MDEHEPLELTDLQKNLAILVTNHRDPVYPTMYRKTHEEIIRLRNELHHAWAHVPGSSPDACPCGCQAIPKPVVLDVG